MEKPYRQHEGKVIEANGKEFKDVMAITLDPRNYKQGIARCITKREGEVWVKGFTDRSELHKISGDSLESFKVGERLKIKNEEEIIQGLMSKDFDFIGLEDPDIWIDQETKLMHVYFTIPLIGKRKSIKNKIHLGHAVGKDLDSLEMTTPALTVSSDMIAKEVSIAPVNKREFRYNLFESKDRTTGISYSVVRVAIVEDMGETWKYGEIVFHPKDHNIPWIGGHASPGPLLPKSFIDVGEGKLLGIINGREASKKMPDGEIKYGIFSVGLFIYDYEDGNIDWVSEEPLIRDSEAVIITFASQFVETKLGEGILYAHVDDSFVRAYTLNAEAIKSLLPNKLQ
jgi:hypothetical protein